MTGLKSNLPVEYLTAHPLVYWRVQYPQSFFFGLGHRSLTAFRWLFLTGGSRTLGRPLLLSLKSILNDCEVKANLNLPICRVFAGRRVDQIREVEGLRLAVSYPNSFAIPTMEDDESRIIHYSSSPCLCDYIWVHAGNQEAVLTRCK